ncbi:hypothetical protein [Hymenobacter jeollabukensis]|uniref:Uncharacterized protein n=1 Tax=Hymenobacter jeollabukensis TaxID=2025313 RepID=A0A5R8WWD1_9BACT|nr:hypothetical protein [Hymenobacter jeollabukensis]TLM96455.1 hypothetical protein FDY95_00185 [Hymenobacter jeollabukensis]
MSDNAAEESAPTPAQPPTEADVLADPRLRELLAGYQPWSQDSFLKSYARVLSDLHYQGEQYEASLEYLLRQHDQEAYRQLWAIQHQKLFDLECQWRAGLVAVPGARLTADFEDWHEAIAACAVIAPISPEELALFDAFLAQLTDPDDLEPDDLCHDFWRYRQYLALHEDDDADLTLTPWTDFWDMRRGTAYLRTLPDRRGELESHYEQAAYAERRRQQPEAVATPPDPRPHAPNFGPEFDTLVRELLRRFEPAVKLRQFETKQELLAYEASDINGDLEVALERLQEAGQVVIPIEAHTDWRQAVIQAGNRYYLDQLRAALPRVYEDYCQRISLGISLAPPREKRRHRKCSHFEADEPLIREGRRALGEPDDLDF